MLCYTKTWVRAESSRHSDILGNTAAVDAVAVAVVVAGGKNGPAAAEVGDVGEAAGSSGEVGCLREM